MGKASSAKKVARAARAGGTRRPGQRRNLGFPILIAAVVVIGVSLVVFARSNREATAAPRSQANEESDHWHAALGVYQCDHFIFDGTPEGGPFFIDQPDARSPARSCWRAGTTPRTPPRASGRPS